ncbi:MAG: peptidyl-prolyl cis-trans isomerase [Elusimicrobia bacterium]|nr:peptidyl-prolyl cis-trans isomerase [Elusimicrobiota bacterium]
MFHAIAAVLLIAAPVRAAGANVPGDFDVVSVNGTTIRQSEVLERLWKRYGSQTLEEMVDELLMRQAAASKKITASSSDIDRRFARLQSQFGSRELLVSQLEQAGTTVAKVREDLADEIVRERLIVEAKGIKIDDAELKKAFDANKDKLGKPEAVHLRHILAKTEAEANEIVAKVKAGADFQTLAREKSLAASGKAAGGDYGFVSRGMLPPEIDEIAFSLKAGEIKVVPGPRGQHILQVVEKRAAQSASFEEVKADLREMLLAEKIKEASAPFLLELRRKADIKTPNQPAKAKTKTK